MRPRTVAAACVLAAAVAACGTPGNDSYLDRKFGDSPKAYTNVFELLKTYTRQIEAPGQMGGVRVIRYYEADGRFAGYTNKAESWFSTVTEGELKARLLARIKKRSGRYDPATDRIEGPVRVNGGVGFHVDNGDCYFIAVFKRVGPTTIYDNDYGDPDFSGYFDICNGLTVPPAEFIARIGLADEAAEARYLARLSRKEPPAASSSSIARTDPSPATKGARKPLNERPWEARPVSVLWRPATEPIRGEITFRHDNRSGRFEIDLPGTTGDCKGTFAMTERRKGTWSFACTDGRTASGELVSYGLGKGAAGTGWDSEGNRVTFTVDRRSSAKR